MKNKSNISDAGIDMLMHNSWQVVSAMYTGDVKLGASIGRYDAYIDDMQYTLYGIDYKSKHKKKTEILLSELVELIDSHKIVIENPEYIEDDIKIFKGRLDSNLHKQYEEYEKYRLKCELLGVVCNDIRCIDNQYILHKLVPDENGVAVIPDFVTNLSPIFNGDDNTDTKYRKIIWKNPLVFSINGMFRFNDKIVNIDLTEFNLSVIPDVHRLFCACRYLETVNFGDNDFHNVTNISEIFKNASRLIEADLSKAKPRRTYLMNSIATGDNELLSLNIPELSQRPVKLSFMHFFKLTNGIIDARTGSNTKFTEIIMNTTSLANILTWIDEYSVCVSNRIVAVYLDKLTGIDYIKSTINEQHAEILGTIRLRSRIAQNDDGDFTESMYKQYINKDILLRFVIINPSGNTGITQHFGRVAVECELDSHMKNSLNSVDSKGYKNRLLLTGYKDDKVTYIVYFNSYTMWGERSI